MKIAYATMIVLCLLATTSWSSPNPLIRNCNLAGGEFTVVEVNMNFKKPYANDYDQWALCKFDKAYVGAGDVLAFNTQSGDPISLTEYTNNTAACTGKIVEGRVLQTAQIIWLCQYSDYSFIDLNTLHSGPFSSDNQKLNNYLGLIFN